MARSRAELGAALAGAVAASAGDLALLWAGWAADGRLGIAAPPPGTLVAGHYLGVLGIPLYGLGYRALATGIQVKKLRDFMRAERSERHPLSARAKEQVAQKGSAARRD